MNDKEIPAYVGKNDISTNKPVERAPSEDFISREDCVLHKGSLTHNGYGQVSYNGKNCRAHRVAWEQEHGKIPKGKIVRHKCDNRSCINVDHLELGTPFENTKDMIERGRMACGESLPQSKLKKGDIPFIRMAKRLITQARLGEMFGVRRETIGEVQRRIRWNHI